MVAALTLPPDGAAYLCLYALREDGYGPDGQSSFTQVVIPYLFDWLTTVRIPRGYGDSCHKTVIVEWTGKSHCFHEVNSQYKTY